ncbi:uncharacterized protein AMSG_05340 [Thecamonas trahens ATCC 50062]|uniref:Calpain catalytic domain-containing protein n=1 Tax=Thecamonas trahens ATCC 50062 TaxID=461836 RepID=A0A0L0DAS8_THETB|nr:hypothetical protein AMSG_05340 [Thecamonas trahens ATCC 50062]KNC49340.1 hypothetical protein AMSG_05340 [Thecamonas trahens ATCC 50062]|eukprot:XP_013758047.1 hypothetical protein AMSG_05340 [Thecamonas trahens ATCC 50062]
MTSAGDLAPGPFAHFPLREDEVTVCREEVLGCRQGRLANCFVVAAIHAIAAAAPDLVPKAHVDDHEGTIAFVLHIGEEMMPTRVVVDDTLPVDDSGALRFMSSSSSPMLPLLEKALAARYGSYNALQGGKISEAFADMLGLPVVTIRLSPASKLASIAAAAALFAAGCPIGLYRSSRNVTEEKLSPLPRGMDVLDDHAYAVIAVADNAVCVLNPHVDRPPKRKTSSARPAPPGASWITLKTVIRSFTRMVIARADARVHDVVTGEFERADGVSTTRMPSQRRSTLRAYQLARTSREGAKLRVIASLTVPHSPSASYPPIGIEALVPTAGATAERDAACGEASPWLGAALAYQRLAVSPYSNSREASLVFSMPASSPVFLQPAMYDGQLSGSYALTVATVGDGDDDGVAPVTMTVVDHPLHDDWPSRAAIDGAWKPGASGAVCTPCFALDIPADGAVVHLGLHPIEYKAKKKAAVPRKASAIAILPGRTVPSGAACLSESLVATTFTNARTVATTVMLAAGSYVVVPRVMGAHVAGKFTLHLCSKVAGVELELLDAFIDHGRAGAGGGAGGGGGALAAAAAVTTGAGPSGMGSLYAGLE